MITLRYCFCSGKKFWRRYVKISAKKIAKFLFKLHILGRFWTCWQHLSFFQNSRKGLSRDPPRDGLRDSHLPPTHTISGIFIFDDVLKKLVVFLKHRAGTIPAGLQRRSWRQPNRPTLQDFDVFHHVLGAQRAGYPHDASVATGPETPSPEGSAGVRRP